MIRKSGVVLKKDYPNYIAPYNLQKLSTRHHPLGKFPQYPSSTTVSHFEELTVAERYEQLVDDWCRIFDREKSQLITPGMEIMLTLSSQMNMMMSSEVNHYPELMKIAEDTIRQYFNMGEDEVLFDLEIINPRSGDKPANHFDFNKGDNETDINDPEFTEDLREEIIRRRLTNAIVQGASLKGHYLFHMARTKLGKIGAHLPRLYNEAMVTNDLMYFYIDDIQCSEATEEESQAGMMEVDFSGDVPVVKVKAFTFTILMHEMVKGVMEILTAWGLPKDPVMAQKVVDECDTVLNEFWDIRIGPKYWERLYNLLEIEDHEYLKHVIVGISKMNTENFLEFMKHLFAEHPAAKTVVNRIIREKKGQIADYELEKVETNDGIDWSSLG